MQEQRCDMGETVIFKQYFLKKKLLLDHFTFNFDSQGFLEIRMTLGVTPKTCFIQPLLLFPKGVKRLLKCIGFHYTLNKFV